MDDLNEGTSRGRSRPESMARRQAQPPIDVEDDLPGFERQSDASQQRVSFRGDGEFLRTVRARVDSHFAGRPKCGDPRLHRKALVITVWFVASFGLLLSANSVAMQLALCVSLALAACGMAFNVFHDANHGALFCSRRANLMVARLTCVLLGPARIFWWQKHHVLHHRFTNIFKWDDDVESRGFLRLSPRQPWLARYRLQPWLFAPLYGFNTLDWFFVRDFVQYFGRRINRYQPIPPMTRGEHLEFWACKAAYFGIFVILPFFFLPALNVVVGLLLFHYIVSIILTFVFQLAHLNDSVDFPIPDGGSNSLDAEWAAHEMATTANFAPDSALVNWYTGGLNYQIEHHLFPRASHTHYPDISGIVRHAAQEFGLPYINLGGFWDAIRGHFQLVRALGAKTYDGSAAV